MKILKNIQNISEYPIYAHPSYLWSMKDSTEIGYIVEDKMVLPYVITKSKFSKAMKLPVEILGDSTLEKQKNFLNSLPSFVKKNFNVSAIRTDNTAVFEAYPEGSKHCKFGSYIIDLTKSVDELFSGLHSKHRNVVRKAQKDGIVVKHGKEYQKDVIDLMKNTYTRQGLASGMNEAYLKRMDEMGGNVEYWIAEDFQGNLQGSAIFLWNKGNSCYYLHGGSAPHTAVGAMNLLIWEAMIYMKAEGVHFFDFVGARVNPEPGSKMEGIQRFKERFGSTLKIGHAFEIVINPTIVKINQILVGIKCKIRGVKYPKSIIDQEIKRGNI